MMMLKWKRSSLLEPCAGKLARTVLRGRECSDALLLPGGTRVHVSDPRQLKPSQRLGRAWWRDPNIWRG
jgi:hypothetical protein